MFYIKTKLPDGKTVKTDVTDENVFTRCPECGKEISVDLAELFFDGNGDLYSSAVICEGCTAKRMKKFKHFKDINITADGLALLSEVLIFGQNLRHLSQNPILSGGSFRRTPHHKTSSHSVVKLLTTMFFRFAFSISAFMPVDTVSPNTHSSSHFPSNTSPKNKPSSRSAGSSSRMKDG